MIDFLVLSDSLFLLLNVLLTVVETGSFKRAADVLGYTQAGISYIINSLEDELGIKLFYREHGGVKLTSDGENLLPLIRQVDVAERNLKDRVNDIKGLSAGKVRISTFNAVSIHWLPGIMRTFKEKYPAIKLKDSYMVAVAENHPFAGSSTYPVSNIYDDSYIMLAFDRSDFYDKIFPGGKRPKPAFIADNEVAALSMISENLGVGIFSQLLAGDAQYPVCFLPLDPPTTRTVGIGVRSMKTCTTATRQFIQHVRDWVAARE